MSSRANVTDLFPAESRDQAPPSGLLNQAETVIAFLNEKTGRRYPARNPRGQSTANSELVMMRLREGYTVADLKSVVALKWREWGHDDKMHKFVSPQTLFRRSNFERYLGELEP